ncbi:MAG: YkoF family thiamine/hydroxymethylpyrimidine-binding protein [Pseudomonadota bacterium]
MIVAIDVSLYPLRDDYIAPIDDIIASFERANDVEVIRHPLSTELRGDYRRVMQVLTDAAEAALTASRPAVLVAKIVASDRIG